MTIAGELSVERNFFHPVVMPSTIPRFEHRHPKTEVTPVSVPKLRHQIVLRALHRMLRPIAYLLIRYRVPIRSFERVARRVYVESAMRRLARPGTPSTQARVVLLTGMPRPAVRAIMRELRQDPYADETTAEQPPAALLAEWAQRDPKYTDANGSPLPLPMKSPRPSFQSLAEDAKLDISYGALLEELRLAGCVDVDADQIAHMRKRFYVPDAPEENRLAALASALESVGDAFNSNMLEPKEPRLYQRQFWLRSVAPDDYDRVRIGLNELLAKHAREVITYLEDEKTELVPASSRALGFGSYLFNDYYHSDELPTVLADPPDNPSE